ncbi:unnamed protein product [Amoebophrya sp. A120]|nr:unnamed protein product [Amoebophrya sp. A120]|eukprot:GSA120T00015229001.1
MMKQNNLRGEVPVGGGGDARHVASKTADGKPRLLGLVPSEDAEGLQLQTAPVGAATSGTFVQDGSLAAECSRPRASTSRSRGDGRRLRHEVEDHLKMGEQAPVSGEHDLQHSNRVENEADEELQRVIDHKNKRVLVLDRKGCLCAITDLLGRIDDNGRSFAKGSSKPAPAPATMLASTPGSTSPSSFQGNLFATPRGAAPSVAATSVTATSNFSPASSDGLGAAPAKEVSAAMRLLQAQREVLKQQIAEIESRFGRHDQQQHVQHQLQVVENGENDTTAKNFASASTSNRVSRAEDDADEEDRPLERNQSADATPSTTASSSSGKEQKVFVRKKIPPCEADAAPFTESSENSEDFRDHDHPVYNHCRAASCDTGWPNDPSHPSRRTEEMVPEGIVAGGRRGEIEESIAAILINSSSPACDRHGLDEHRDADHAPRLAGEANSTCDGLVHTAALNADANTCDSVHTAALERENARLREELLRWCQEYNKHTSTTNTKGKGKGAYSTKASIIGESDKYNHDFVKASGSRSSRAFTDSTTATTYNGKTPHRSSHDLSEDESQDDFSSSSPATFHPPGEAHLSQEDSAKRAGRTSGDREDSCRGKKRTRYNRDDSLHARPVRSSCTFGARIHIDDEVDDSSSPLCSFPLLPVPEEGEAVVGAEERQESAMVSRIQEGVETLFREYSTASRTTATCRTSSASSCGRLPTRTSFGGDVAAAKKSGSAGHGGAGARQEASEQVRVRTYSDGQVVEQDHEDALQENEKQQGPSSPLEEAAAREKRSGNVLRTDDVVQHQVISSTSANIMAVSKNKNMLHEWNNCKSQISISLASSPASKWSENPFSVSPPNRSRFANCDSASWLADEAQNRAEAEVYLHATFPHLLDEDQQVVGTTRHVEEASQAHFSTEALEQEHDELCGPVFRRTNDDGQGQAEEQMRDRETKQKVEDNVVHTLLHLKPRHLHSEVERARTGTVNSTGRLTPRLQMMLSSPHISLKTTHTLAMREGPYHAPGTGYWNRSPSPSRKNAVIYSPGLRKSACSSALLLSVPGSAPGNEEPTCDTMNEQEADRVVVVPRRRPQVLHTEFRPPVAVQRGTETSFRPCRGNDSAIGLFVFTRAPADAKERNRPKADLGEEREPAAHNKDAKQKHDGSKGCVYSHVSPPTSGESQWQHRHLRRNEPQQHDHDAPCDPPRRLRPNDLGDVCPLEEVAELQQSISQLNEMLRQGAQAPVPRRVVVAESEPFTTCSTSGVDRALHSAGGGSLSPASEKKAVVVHDAPFEMLLDILSSSNTADNDSATRHDVLDAEKTIPTRTDEVNFRPTNLFTPRVLQAADETSTRHAESEFVESRNSFGAPGSIEIDEHLPAQLVDPDELEDDSPMQEPSPLQDQTFVHVCVPAEEQKGCENLHTITSVPENRTAVTHGNRRQHVDPEDMEEVEQKDTINNVSASSSSKRSLEGMVAQLALLANVVETT